MYFEKPIRAGSGKIKKRKKTKIRLSDGNVKYLEEYKNKRKFFWSTIVNPYTDGYEINGIKDRLKNVKMDVQPFVKETATLDYETLQYLNYTNLGKIVDNLFTPSKYRYITDMDDSNVYDILPSRLYHIEFVRLKLPHILSHWKSLASTMDDLDFWTKRTRDVLKFYFGANSVKPWSLQILFKQTAEQKKSEPEYRESMLVPMFQKDGRVARKLRNVPDAHSHILRLKHTRKRTRIEYYKICYSMEQLENQLHDIIHHYGRNR